MAFLNNYEDFIKYQAAKVGMTREEYMSILMSENKKKPGPDPYHRGLDDDEVEDKEAQIKKQAKMDDDDPDAYKEMPGDKEAREKGEVKKSKHTKKYAELYGEAEELDEGLGISMGMIEPFLPVIIGYIESGGAGRLVHKIKNNLKAIPKVINNFRNMKDITRILNKLEKHPKIDGYLNNLDPEGVEVMFQELSMADMKIMYSHLGLDWNPKEYLEIKRKADKGEWANEAAEAEVNEKQLLRIKDILASMVGAGFSARTNPKMRDEISAAVKAAIMPILKDYGYAIQEDNDLDESLEDAIEKEMENNDSRFKTPFPTRELRQIKYYLQDAEKYPLSNSAKKVLDKLKKEYKLDEGAMSAIHQMADEVKDEAEFIKRFFKEFGAKIKKTKDSEEWAKSLYTDMVNEKFRYVPQYDNKGYEEAQDLIAKLRSKTYKKLDDAEFDEFRRAMIDHFDLEIPDYLRESEAHDGMAYGQLERIVDYANMLRDRYDNGFTFDPWMHSLITKSKSYLNSVYDAIDGGDGEIEEANGFVKTFDQLVNEKDQSGENDQSPIDDDKIETALKKKAEDTGVPIGIIRVIMRRGMAAWKSGHRPGANQQQWGYARVNSFLTKQEGTWGKADADMAKKVRDGGHDKNLKKG